MADDQTTMKQTTETTDDSETALDSDVTGDPDTTADSRPTRSPPASNESPPASSDAVLKLAGVTKRYGSETAVSELDLTVREGELLTLLGPSGCGKTTTLRMIAGLETPTDGIVTVDGDVVTGDGATVPPEGRDVGMVFQEFALFPHLTVAENVAFGLTDLDSEATDARVTELLELVGLAEYGGREPGDLSGGQRQRVALARSLAPEPDVLLLDEPFSNLDVRLRIEMREEVKAILEEAGVTAVSVTHDQEEALSISDRVAVVHDGQIEQVGSPEAVFEHPESRFVASFLGQASFLAARVGESSVDTAIGAYDRGLLEGITDDYDGATVDVLVRPDDLRATPAPEPEADGRVVRRQYTGPTFVYHVELDDGGVVRCLHNHAEEFDVGEPVDVALVADHTLAWYPAER
jgi:iron(III) transport system ATP-binding protein